MKRWVLHGIFWLVYLVQDIFLHYTWMGTLMKDYSEREQFWMAIQTAMVVLPPKLLVVYYFIGYGLKKLLSDRKLRPAVLVEMALILLFSIALFRATFHFVVNPHIYFLPVNLPLFLPRNVLIAVLEIGYITGIAIAFKLLRMQTLSKEREKNLAKEKLETELKFLRNQTNPHFLFNTLNNIYALTRKKSDNAPEVVLKLSELLSFMLYESGKEHITIAGEIKILEDYISLERIRYNDRLSISFKKEIDDLSQPVAPLLFLPLVENAFKHGASETRFDTYIGIEMRLNKKSLTFVIENSMENGKPHIGTENIGLGNSRRQLELLYKEHSMKVSTQQKTFKVDITINLDSYGKN
jgi:two-component system, LytTR family, sensor kinase